MGQKWSRPVLLHHLFTSTSCQHLVSSRFFYGIHVAHLCGFVALNITLGLIYLIQTVHDRGYKSFYNNLHWVHLKSKVKKNKYLGLGKPKLLVRVVSNLAKVLLHVVTSANSLNYLWYVCVFDKYLWIIGLLIFLSLFWIIFINRRRTDNKMSSQRTKDKQRSTKIVP
jgi:hypothetical protein